MINLREDANLVLETISGLNLASKRLFGSIRPLKKKRIKLSHILGSNYARPISSVCDQFAASLTPSTEE